MPEKKIVIKLNYSASSPRDMDLLSAGSPAEVEWNFLRIFTALGLLVLLVLIIYLIFNKYFVSSDSDANVQNNDIAALVEHSDTLSQNKDKLDIVLADEEGAVEAIEKASAAVFEKDRPTTVPAEQSETSVSVATAIDEIVSQSESLVSESIIQDRGVGVASSQPAASAGIARALFTRKIVNREPVGEIQSPLLLSAKGTDEIYFYSEFRGVKDSIRIHEWLLESKVMAKVEFNIGGNRWRVYSHKALNRKMFGDWTVKITDGDGIALAEYFLNLKPAP